MREILFRGKRLDNCEWVYGSLHVEYGEMARGETERRVDYRILGMRGEVDYVDPDTVGQNTGLKDKNGKRIFEGDIFEDRKEDMYAVVVFKDGCFRLEWHGITGAWMEYGFDECGGGWGIVECESFDMYHIGNFEIIGNIHDNRELMGGGE